MEWNGDKFQEAIGTALKHGNLAAAREYVGQVQSALNRGGKGPFSPGATPSAPGTPPHKSTGALARSFSAHQHHNGFSAMVSTTSKYAILHEFGGTILPKGRYLVFPVTIDGRRHLRAHGGSVRNAMGDPAVYVKKNRLGGLLVFRKVGKRKVRSVLLYVMKSVVIMPPRPYIVPTLKAKTAEMAGAYVHAFRKNLVMGVLK